MNSQNTYANKQTTIDELRAQIGTPTELLQQYYGLTPKRGKVCCFVHADRTPSMKVYSDKVHCFGCGWHGDSLDIYAKANNMALQEAIRHLRHQAGDTGEGWREKALEDKRRRQIEAKVYEEANACFRHVQRLHHGIERLLPRFQIADAENEARQNALHTLLLMQQAAEDVLPLFYSGEAGLQELDGLRAAKGAGLWP